MLLRSHGRVCQRNAFIASLCSLARMRASEQTSFIQWVGQLNLEHLSEKLLVPNYHELSKWRAHRDCPDELQQKAVDAPYRRNSLSGLLCLPIARHAFSSTSKCNQVWSAAAVPAPTGLRLMSTCVVLWAQILLRKEHRMLKCGKH